jgi:hypothetical protein
MVHVLSSVNAMNANALLASSQRLLRPRNNANASDVPAAPWVVQQPLGGLTSSASGRRPTTDMERIPEDASEPCVPIRSSIWPSGLGPSTTERGDGKLVARGSSGRQPPSRTPEVALEPHGTLPSPAQRCSLQRTLTDKARRVQRSDSMSVFAMSSAQQEAGLSQLTAEGANTVDELEADKLAFVGTYRHLGRVSGSRLDRSAYVAPMPFVSPAISMSVAHDPGISAQRPPSNVSRISYCHLDLQVGMHSLAALLQMVKRTHQVS